MIGGSVIGKDLGGVWVFDALKVTLPTDSVTITDYVVSVAGGASVGLPVDAVSINDFAVEIKFFLKLNLPVDEVDLTDFAISVAGGASIALPLDSVTIEDFPLNVRILIRGVPDWKFVPDSNPTTVDIVISNRESKTVRVRRADEYNISYVNLTDINSDTFQDTGLNPDLSYKYSLQFVVIEAVGQKSTGKYNE